MCFIFLSGNAEERLGWLQSAERMASSSTSSSSRPSAGTGAEFAHLFVFANEKAGMMQVDMSKVNDLVYEISKDSEHFKEAQRRDERTQEEVTRLRSKMEQATEQDLVPVRHRLKLQIEKLEQERDLSRIFCVVDMDMFFAAVEMRDDPSLIGKPMAVGGMSMISTANYEARKFGVRSAMPGFIAVKLCPELIFVKGSFGKYGKASEEVKAVLREYDPSLSGHLDEAFMDLTDFIDSKLGLDRTLEERMRFAEQTVEEMRKRVSEKTKLTCSAGIALTRMLAKIASDKNKPNGQFVVPWELDEMIDFARGLPIRKIPGIGKVTEKKLKELFGVTTVQDLWNKRVEFSYLFKPIMSGYLLRVCLCCTGAQKETSENSPRQQKSASKERTFSNGASNPQELFDICQDICAKLASHCVEKGIIGRCVTLKLKKTNFEVLTRQNMLPVAVPRSSDGSDLFPHARELLSKELPCKLRLMGVMISKLDQKIGASTNFTSSSSSEAIPRLKDMFRKQEPSHLKRMDCPVCSQKISGGSIEIQFHVDECLKRGAKRKSSQMQLHDLLSEQKVKKQNKTTFAARCPICGKDLHSSDAEINMHVDQCLKKPEVNKH